VGIDDVSGMLELSSQTHPENLLVFD